MGESPMEKSHILIELLLCLNRATQVLLSPLANLIDECNILGFLCWGLLFSRGPYGISRYTWCGTAGKYYREKYNGKIPWRHPLAATIQHLTEFWLRDKKHTKEAANHEMNADLN